MSFPLNESHTLNKPFHLILIFDCKWSHLNGPHTSCAHWHTCEYLHLSTTWRRN